MISSGPNVSAGTPGALTWYAFTYSFASGMIRTHGVGISHSSPGVPSRVSPSDIGATYQKQLPNRLAFSLTARRGRGRFVQAFGWPSGEGEVMVPAYSYLRFSSPQQAAGDSV